MTIDEAIVHAREVAEKQRKDNEDCIYKVDYGCKGCADYYSKPCAECAKEHEQLAEWLEELKELRELKDTITSNAEVLERQGYNKAIDDFVQLVKKHNWHIGNRNENSFIYGAIDKLAEQLKVGERDEF